MTRKRTQEEAENKTKTKHWRENSENPTITKRPGYQEKLNRKECNAIIKTRTSMLPEKMNQKSNKVQKNTTCRYCKSSPETQKHIIEECKETPWTNEEIKYKNIFKNKDVHVLKNMANWIIRIVESMETHNEDQTAWAPPDEPPGYLGECNTTTTIYSTQHMNGQVYRDQLQWSVRTYKAGVLSSPLPVEYNVVNPIVLPTLTQWCLQQNILCSLHCSLSLNRMDALGTTDLMAWRQPLQSQSCQTKILIHALGRAPCPEGLFMFYGLSVIMHIWMVARQAIHIPELDNQTTCIVHMVYGKYPRYGLSGRLYVVFEVPWVDCFQKIYYT